MLNMNNTHTQVLADNAIAINGVTIGKLTDADAQHLWDIVNGMVSLYANAPVASAPKTGLTFADDAPKAAPAREIRPAEDVDITLEGKDNAVWYSATARDIRTVVNAQLKAAGFVYDKDAERPDVYKRDYTRDGVTYKAGTHKHGAWVLMKGSKRDIAGAKPWIGKCITVTANERTAVREGWEARKARREG